METKTIASESTHWYDADGKSAYEVQGKNGEMRPTTLRDARKHSLSPSVTTVLNLVAKPGLEAWKANQIVDSALTLPQLEGESLDDFKTRILLDSKEQGQKAAQLGTAIHASLDKAYSGKEYDPDHSEYVKAVQEAIFLRYGDQDWMAEKSFTHPLGFGGKIDLACTATMLETEGGAIKNHSVGMVIDFKSVSSFNLETKVSTLGYPENCWQLAAYATGLCIQSPILVNVYVSTQVPGLIYIKEWTQEEADWGWQCFNSILQAWFRIKKYRPGEEHGNV